MGRIDRVNEQVKREVGKIIHQKLSDPRLQFVTITDADVSRDFQNAKIHFSVLGGEKELHDAKNGLESAKGMIRRVLGHGMNMRRTPELFFIHDQSIEMSVRIEETLKEIHDDHEEHHSDNQEE